jgi:hypothetical protein
MLQGHVARQRARDLRRVTGDLLAGEWTEDLKNSRNDTVTLQLVDPHTVDSIYRRDDQLAQKDRWVVSADGQQMTLSTTGSLESGQRVTEKLVFKKQ